MTGELPWCALMCGNCLHTTSGLETLGNDDGNAKENVLSFCFGAILTCLIFLTWQSYPGADFVVAALKFR